VRRKLALAGALLHTLDVLILDEPLNGLDPQSTRRLKDLFAQLAADGTTILLATHDLATAEKICQRIGILHHDGHLLAEGSPAELRLLAAAPDLESVFLGLTAHAQEVLYDPASASLRTARFDRRLRAGAICTLLVQSVLALWALSRLTPVFAQWQA